MFFIYAFSGVRRGFFSACCRRAVLSEQLRRVSACRMDDWCFGVDSRRRALSTHRAAVSKWSFGDKHRAFFFFEEFFFGVRRGTGPDSDRVVEWRPPLLSGELRPQMPERGPWVGAKATGHVSAREDPIALFFLCMVSRSYLRDSVFTFQQVNKPCLQARNDDPCVAFTFSLCVPQNPAPRGHGPFFFSVFFSPYSFSSI